MSSFSLVRMAPLNRQTSMLPSAIASTSLILASIATGQKTMSKVAATSRIFSWMVRTAISQPPQEAAQYMANFGLPVSAMRRLHRFERVPEGIGQGMPVPPPSHASSAAS